MPNKKRVLILCTGNSCRSQMAEGWVNAELGDAWEAKSAGTVPADAVHPLAVTAMAEVGIDISAAQPQSIEIYMDEDWDLVVTVCDSAKENCPIFPKPAESLHISFPDPADAQGSEVQIIEVFRTVRDAIREQLLAQVARRS